MSLLLNRCSYKNDIDRPVQDFAVSLNFFTEDNKHFNTGHTYFPREVFEKMLYQISEGKKTHRTRKKRPLRLRKKLRGRSYRSVFLVQRGHSCRDCGVQHRHEGSGKEGMYNNS